MTEIDWKGIRKVVEAYPDMHDSVGPRTDDEWENVKLQYKEIIYWVNNYDLTDVPRVIDKRKKLDKILLSRFFRNGNGIRNIFDLQRVFQKTYILPELDWDKIDLFHEYVMLIRLRWCGEKNPYMKNINMKIKSKLSYYQFKSNEKAELKWVKTEDQPTGEPGTWVASNTTGKICTVEEHSVPALYKALFKIKNS